VTNGEGVTARVDGRVLRRLDRRSLRSSSTFGSRCGCTISLQSDVSEGDSLRSVQYLRQIAFSVYLNENVSGMLFWPRAMCCYGNV
jgi:hypothetical protein